MITKSFLLQFLTIQTRIYSIKQSLIHCKKKINTIFDVEIKYFDIKILNY